MSVSVGVEVIMNDGVFVDYKVFIVFFFFG